MSFRVREWLAGRSSKRLRDEYDYTGEAFHQFMEDENVGLRKRFKKLFVVADRIKRSHLATCPECKTTFVRTTKNRKFCSKSCLEKDWYRRVGQARAREKKRR